MTLHIVLFTNETCPPAALCAACNVSHLFIGCSKICIVSQQCLVQQKMTIRPHKGKSRRRGGSHSKERCLAIKHQLELNLCCSTTRLQKTERPSREHGGLTAKVCCTCSICRSTSNTEDALWSVCLHVWCVCLTG